jgi:hypothetical protein
VFIPRIDKDIKVKMKASLWIASFWVSASCIAADTYQVSTTVYTHGEKVASPVLLVEADKMASITIGNDFSYSLTVTPNPDQTARIATEVTVGDNRIMPSFTVTYGTEATMEVGAQKLTLLVSKVGS